MRLAGTTSGAGGSAQGARGTVGPSGPVVEEAADQGDGAVDRRLFPDDDRRPFQRRTELDHDAPVRKDHAPQCRVRAAARAGAPADPGSIADPGRWLGVWCRPRSPSAPGPSRSARRGCNVPVAALSISGASQPVRTTVEQPPQRTQSHGSGLHGFGSGRVDIGHLAPPRCLPATTLRGKWRAAFMRSTQVSMLRAPKNE